MACHYKISWESDPDYCTWIAPVPGDDSKAKCTVCPGETTINIKAMGVSALVSHAKGQKHKTALLRDKDKPMGADTLIRAKQLNHTSVGKSSREESGQSSSAGYYAKRAKQQQDMEHFLTREAAHKAEILWALEVVKTHQSFRSNEEKSALFAKMFPDSEIAKQYAMGRTKVMYLITYGIAPYYEDDLYKRITPVECYSASFDEVLNQSSQVKQMDLLIR